jgi:hypothetical protein
MDVIQQAQYSLSMLLLFIRLDKDCRHTVVGRLNGMIQIQAGCKQNDVGSIA